MKEFWTTIQVAFAAVGGWLGWFMGGCDGLLYALLAFVVLDYITGVMCAIVDHKLSSEIGFKGIFKKLLIFELVGIGHIIDAQVIGNGSVLRTAVIFFYMHACFKFQQKRSESQVQLTITRCLLISGRVLFMLGIWESIALYR